MLGYASAKSARTCSRAAPSSGDACHPEKTTLPDTADGAKPLAAPGLAAGLPAAGLPAGSGLPAAPVAVVPWSDVHAPIANAVAMHRTRKDRRIERSSVDSSRSQPGPLRSWVRAGRQPSGRRRSIRPCASQVAEARGVGRFGCIAAAGCLLGWESTRFVTGRLTESAVLLSREHLIWRP